jgi:nicotinamide mononucleotide adenylyltransferase
VNDAYAKKELANGVHRCEMLKLALMDSDWIRLSTWEIRQETWTRTRTSLQHHQTLINSIVQGQSDANRNTIDNEDLEWIPESIRNNEMADQIPIQIKLLCGGDLLESFATPGLWAEEDVS